MGLVSQECGFSLSRSQRRADLALMVHNFTCFFAFVEWRRFGGLSALCRLGEGWWGCRQVMGDVPFPIPAAALSSPVCRAAHGGDGVLGEGRKSWVRVPSCSCLSSNHRIPVIEQSACGPGFDPAPGRTLETRNHTFPPFFLYKTSRLWWFCVCFVLFLKFFFILNFGIDSSFG